MATPEEEVARLRQEVADLKLDAKASKASIARLEQSVVTRDHDNKTLRDAIKAKDAELADLAAKVPADGALVLGADEAKAFTDYRELGDLSLLKEKLGGYDDALGKLAKAERFEVVRKAAEAHGWKAAIAEDQLRDVELKVVKDDKGEEVVVVPQSGKAAQPVEEWMKENRGDYLPALAMDEKPRPPLGGAGGPAPGKPVDVRAEKRKIISM
jgi:hypothetical protein